MNCVACDCPIARRLGQGRLAPRCRWHAEWLPVQALVAGECASCHTHPSIKPTEARPREPSSLSSSTFSPESQALCIRFSSNYDLHSHLRGRTYTEMADFGESRQRRVGVVAFLWSRGPSRSHSSASAESAGGFPSERLIFFLLR